MPAQIAFDAASLTDDELRAALAVARQRLAHEEVCEHCARLKEDRRDSAVSMRREVAEFNDHAAQAGFVVGSKRNLVHRWDCSSIQSYLQSVSSWLERQSLDDLTENVDRGYEPSLPRVLTEEEARAYLNGGRSRRTCGLCSPDL